MKIDLCSIPRVYHFYTSRFFQILYEKTKGGINDLL